MTDEYDRIAPVIAMAQRLHLSLHDQLARRGVAPIDTLIGGAFALHQAATATQGDPVAAIEWLRDTIDTIERQLLLQRKAAH